MFAQALLDKLLYDKGPFPLKQATLKLMTTPEQPATALGGATIFTADGKATTGVAARGFGWDINSAFSRPRGEVFPIGSFGHTGFTGTSLWMDPGFGYLCGVAGEFGASAGGESDFAVAGGGGYGCGEGAGVGQPQGRR